MTAYTYPPPPPAEPDPDILRRGAILLSGEKHVPDGETWWQRMLRETAERHALATWNHRVQGWQKDPTP